MISVKTIRSAIECSLDPGEKVVYLSHPVTTGGRPMADNIARAAEIAALARKTFAPSVVLNPMGIGHIEGWDHPTWMRLWLPFIRERVDVMLLAEGWEESTGRTLERDCAIASELPLLYFDGEMFGCGV